MPKTVIPVQQVVESGQYGFVSGLPIRMQAEHQYSVAGELCEDGFQRHRCISPYRTETVCGWMQIHLHFMSSQPHRGTDGRQGIAGYAVSSHRADSGIFHEPVAGDNGRSAGTVLPAMSAEFYVFIMGRRFSAESGRFVVFVMGIKLRGFQTHTGFHVHQHFPGGGDDHAGAADVGTAVQRNGGTHHIGVGVVRQKPAHDFQCLVGVAPLQGTADDDVHIFSGDGGKGFVKIEVIAGQKSVPDTVNGQHIGRGGFEGVV